MPEMCKSKENNLTQTDVGMTKKIRRHFFSFDLNYEKKKVLKLFKKNNFLFFQNMQNIKGYNIYKEISIFITATTN